MLERKKRRLFKVSGKDADNVALTREVGVCWSAPVNWCGYMHKRSADHVIAHVNALVDEIERLEFDLAQAEFEAAASGHERD